jgi:hypothetical protein
MTGRSGAISTIHPNYVARNVDYVCTFWLSTHILDLNNSSKDILMRPGRRHSARTTWRRLAAPRSKPPAAGCASHWIIPRVWIRNLRRQVQFTNGVNIMTPTMHDGDLVTVGSWTDLS